MCVDWKREGGGLEWESWTLGTLLHVTYYTFRACLFPIIYVPFPFDDGVLL